MSDALRSLWDEPRAPNPPRRVWRDWVLVGALVVGAGVEGLLRPDLPAPAFWVLVVLALAPTLLWRRTHPLAMAAIAFGTSTALSLVAGDEPELFSMVAMLALPYALYRWGSGREIVLGSAIVLTAAGTSVVGDGTSLGDAVGGVAVLAATVGLGLAFRYRAGAMARELEQARLVEREELARELHDTVAHHVSAMAIRAQAGLATSASRPEAAVDALVVIEAEAARTLAEMRDMVRVLRRDRPGDRAPTPGIADLARLAGASRGGPPVDVEVSGDLAGLPPAVGTAIYRLAQEAVTNAVRHARHATRIDVRVAADATSVRLRVSDDGEVHPASRPAAGYGLVGMQERADLLGGSCEAGPGPDRGWTVTAVLPRVGARS